MSVCINCEKKMFVRQIGVALVETVGKEQHPHSVIQADIEECPKCMAQIIARVADENLFHFDEGFQEAIDKAIEQNRIYYVHEKEPDNGPGKKIQSGN